MDATDQGARLTSLWDASDDPPWHFDGPHPLLVDNWEKITSDLSEKRVFMPAVGKSVDILFFVERGFEVYANEISRRAVELFFADNKIEHVVTSLGDSVPGDYFASADGRIKFFCCDVRLLSLDVMGCAAPFEIIWDRAFLGAFSPQVRHEFADPVRALLHPDRALYCAIAFEVNKPGYTGPPFSVTQQEFEAIFPGFSVGKQGYLDLKKFEKFFEKLPAALKGDTHDVHEILWLINFNM